MKPMKVVYVCVDCVEVSKMLFIFTVVINGDLEPKGTAMIFFKHFLIVGLQSVSCDLCYLQHNYC